MKNCKLNPLAEILNEDLSKPQNAAFELLSEKGKKIFFPSKGILGQSAEAKDAKINATIGTAFEEDGSPLSLECIEELVNIPSESFLYTPSFGMPSLRAKWKEMIFDKNPSLKGKQISLPVVTSALTHALSVCGYLFVNEEDKIILSDLNWDNYELIFEHGFNGELETYKTFEAGKYNVGGLKEKLMSAGDKKILLLNFPNNPAGYTLTEKEALDVKACILKAAEAGKKIVVILDDAYFGLVYEEGVFKESLFSLLSDLHPNVLAVKLDGPTKEDYVWGFRVGFITFGIKNSTPEQLKAFESKAAGVVRGGISNCSSIGQHLLLKGFSNTSYQKQKEKKYSILKERYLKIKNIFSKHPEYEKSFSSVPFNSGYFMCVKPIGVDAESVRKDLLASFGTGVIVLSGLIRIAFLPYNMKNSIVCLQILIPRYEKSKVEFNVYNPIQVMLMKNLSQLFKNNRKWVSEITNHDPDFFSKLKKKQSPEYLWIGCSDSRVPANEIVGLLPGELFVHRNVGNLVIHTDMNCLSVIQYAVDFLKIKHIIVCGHYGCGGIKTALDYSSHGIIDNWLLHVRDIFNRKKNEFKTHSNKTDTINRLCELNVIEQAINVGNTTVIQEAWTRGQAISIHGWIYDISDGLLKKLIDGINSQEKLNKLKEL